MSLAARLALGSTLLAVSLDAMAQTHMSDPLRIVAFGTSLTSRGGWPEAVRDRIAGCLDRTVELTTVAKAGATSQWGLENVGRVVAVQPNIVVIEFYANDAAMDEFISVSSSTQTMRRIIARIQAADRKTRIIYMAFSPMWGLRSWIRPRLERYIEAHRDVAKDMDVTFVDLRPDWAKLSQPDLDAAFPDGIHPLPEVAAQVVAAPLATLIAGKSCSVAPELNEQDR